MQWLMNPSSTITSPNLEIEKHSLAPILKILNSKSWSGAAFSSVLSQAMKKLLELLRKLNLSNFSFSTSIHKTPAMLSPAGQALSSANSSSIRFLFLRMWFCTWKMILRPRRESSVWPNFSQMWLMLKGDKSAWEPLWMLPYLRSNTN